MRMLWLYLLLFLQLIEREMVIEGVTAFVLRHVNGRCDATLMISSK